MTSDKSREMVKLAYQAMDDKKAGNIKILDISDITPIADFFIICSGSNSSQMDAIIDNVTETLGRAGYDAKRSEGGRNSGWILMDYNDIVVHVFSKEDRLFYDLERIWRDGKVIEASEL